MKNKNIIGDSRWWNCFYIRIPDDHNRFERINKDAWNAIWHSVYMIYIYIYYRCLNEYTRHLSIAILTLYGKSESFMSTIFFSLSFYIFKNSKTKISLNEILLGIQMIHNLIINKYKILIFHVIIFQWCKSISKFIRHN